MAARLGYGGLANTSGIRDFASREESVAAIQTGSRVRRIVRRQRHYHRIILFLFGL